MDHFLDALVASLESILGGGDDDLGGGDDDLGGGGNLGDFCQVICFGHKFSTTRKV